MAAAEQLKVEDVQEWLKFHGIDPMQVSRDPGVRIVVPTPMSGGVFIEVREFVLNSEGKRFVDSAASAVAIQTRMVPLLRFP